MRFKHIMRASHVKSTVRRWAAFLLCAALVGGMISSALPAMAAVDADGEADEEIYCEHHAEHTEECGYVEAVEGQPCTHEHDDECGYAEAVECSHVHDDSCGYVEAVEGQPCQFVCDICVGGSEETAEELEEIEEDSEQIAAMSDVMPLADVNEKGLIAYFTFDDSSNRLHNYASGSSVTAELHSVSLNNAALGNRIDDASLENYFNGTDKNKNSLHLEDNSACLVLDNIGAIKGLNELTVEMRVNISDAQKEHWLFYASPEANVAGTENCLGAVIRANNTQLRTIRNNSYQVNYSPGGVLQLDSWHKIRVVYKISTMALYIDDKRVAEYGAGGKSADYLKDNTAIWVGHSAFPPDTNFNGYIDDIKIYNYAKDDYPINEQKYIITEDVRDPANTTVHMFDYWITDQLANDFNPPLTLDQVRDGGINEGHLFLFAGNNGSDAALNEDEENDLNNALNVGSWNSYYFDQPYDGSVALSKRAQYEPFSGIVDNILGDDGYPRLALDKLKPNKDLFKEPTDGWYESGNPTESLAYLFDPGKSNAGKAVYPNVTGLFQLNREGYYYFDCNETFAELNRDQSRRPKESKGTTGNNKITLYRRSSEYKDFFPFNDATDLFYIKMDDKLDKANGEYAGMGVQATTDEPFNHYFGMTVETKFKQPTDGYIDRPEGKEHMNFDFSGDDDVWIFIDGVLVADLGGLHDEVRVNIDFATGVIDFTGGAGQELNGSDGRTCFDTTLKEMFKNAYKDNGIEWNENEWNGELFSDGSAHTLKFFYLERGNNASRCTISFNLYYDEDDRPKRSYEEQLPEEIEILDLSAELPAGVLASPHTGDSKMVVAWITLLVFSITGVIVLHRTRKRANKH